jgi:hypothetical protein
MKKLLLTLSIVSLLAACDNGGNGGKMENTEIKEKEQVELKDAEPISNIHHVRNGDEFTITWDNPKALWKIGLIVYVYYDSNPVLMPIVVDFGERTPLVEEYTFTFKVAETAIQKRMKVHFVAWHDGTVKKSELETDYWIDL